MGRQTCLYNPGVNFIISQSIISSTSDKSADEYAAALGSFIKAIIHKANDSYWYLVYLKPNDYASSIDTSIVDNEEEKAELKKVQKRLQQLYPSSLEARTSLKEQYNKACVTIGLLKEVTLYNKQPSSWHRPICLTTINYELVPELLLHNERTWIGC